MPCIRPCSFDDLRILKRCEHLEEVCFDVSQGQERWGWEMRDEGRGEEEGELNKQLYGKDL